MPDARSKGRPRLQVLRHLFSRSPNATDDILSSSSSTLAIPTSSKAASFTPSNAPSASFQSTSSSVQPCALSANTRECDLLDKALALLDERERVTIQRYLPSGTDDVESALEGILEAAKEKQKICVDKRWTFTAWGHTVRLREEADKVILWLDRFKTVGDIAVNADPIHAGLPWAGIRVLLEVWNHTTYPFLSLN